MLTIDCIVFPVERFVVVVVVLVVVVLVVVVVVVVVVVMLCIRSSLASNNCRTSFTMVELLHIGILHVYITDDWISVADIVFDSKITP